MVLAGDYVQLVLFAVLDGLDAELLVRIELSSRDVHGSLQIKHCVCVDVPFMALFTRASVFAHRGTMVCRI